MKKLFILQDSLVNKISYFHLALLMASLPFDMIYSHIILISFALHTLIQLDVKKLKSIFNPRILASQSVFWVTAISTIYTTYKPEAFNEWGRQITIIVLPILLTLSNLDLKKYRANLLSIFSIICTASIVYLYIDAIHTIQHYHLPLRNLFTDTFTNHNFSEPLAIHATFLSMQLIVALIFLITALPKENKASLKVFYAFCILILTLGLLQLCSKSALFCLFVAANFVVPFYVFDKTRRRKFITTILAISFICLTGVLSVKTFRDRLFTSLELDIAKPKPGALTEERMARWQTGAELIAKAPVIGHGAGSEIELLHEAFYQKKYYTSFLQHLNVHNQYLSFLIKSGLIGLLIYLITLWLGFKWALKQADPLFLTFMLLLAVVSLSENLLDVDKGIIFYAFFFSFFTFSAGEKAGINIQPTGNRLTAKPVIVTEHNTEEIVFH